MDVENRKVSNIDARFGYNDVDDNVMVVTFKDIDARRLIKKRSSISQIGHRHPEVGTTFRLHHRSPNSM